MLKIIHSSLFIIVLFSYSLTARVLPQDVVWNEEETGYYTIKENNKQSKEQKPKRQHNTTSYKKENSIRKY